MKSGRAAQGVKSEIWGAAGGVKCEIWGAAGGQARGGQLPAAQHPIDPKVLSVKSSPAHDRFSGGGLVNGAHFINAGRSPGCCKSDY